MSIQCSKDITIRIYIVKVLEEIQNLMINFPGMYTFHQHIKKTNSRKQKNKPAGCVSFLFPDGQSFYFSNWHKTLFAVLAESKMKALK